MKYAFASLAFAALSLAASPPDFKIDAITYGGTACPQGSLNVVAASSGIIPLVFDSFTASVGPNVAVTESRKNCQLNLAIEATKGFQFAVYTADYHGWASIDNGVTGTVKTTYYFSGQTDEVSTEEDIDGPFTGQFSRHDVIPAAAIWSGCGGEGLLNINAQVRLTQTNANAKGVISVDRESGKFTSVLGLQWREC